MTESVSIIMPAYNEGEHIFHNISLTQHVLEEAGITAEIIVVDDGSEDHTLREIERASETFENVVVARNPYNMGKGMALRTGFDYSHGGIVVFLDADLDLHPSQVTKLISTLIGGGYDVVVTSKHHPKSQLDYPWFRKAASWVYYMVIKALFGLPVRDTQTGLKVFRREVLDTIFHRILVKKFAYDVELLANAVRFGYKVHEMPVVLNFRRNLSWGRIRLEDIASIFVDTLAIFYRLKILRYYDAARPPMSKENKSVLVVIQGCPPPDAVIQRLSVDSNTHIACITQDRSLRFENVLFFDKENDFMTWIQGKANDYDYIGFLGAGYLPVGSWIKNAIRNFDNPCVIAVCGPIIPGLFDSRRGKAASLLYSSSLTAGPDDYLRSVRLVRTVKKGLMDNIFFRTDFFKQNQKTSEELVIDRGYLYSSGNTSGSIKYDPDVAVSRTIPSLFFPYLDMVARGVYKEGYHYHRSKHKISTVWHFVPMLVCVCLSLGWLFLPAWLYIYITIICLLIVMMTVIFCFDLKTAPVFMVGIILEYFVRACSFPAGLIASAVKLQHPENKNLKRIL